jgi:hypothetical protein
MQVPVYVRRENGRFVAQAVGVCELAAAGATLDEAVGAMRTLLAETAAAGQLVKVDVEADPLMQMAGKYHDDPWLEEIVEEIYRLRDQEEQSADP